MKRICCVQTGKTFKSSIDLSLSLGRGRYFAAQITKKLAKDKFFKYKDLTYKHIAEVVEKENVTRKHNRIICNETGEIFRSATALVKTIRNGTLSKGYSGWICKKIKETGVYEDLETGLTYNFTSRKDIKPISDDKDSSYISTVESLTIQMIKDKDYAKAIKLLNVLI